MSTTISPEILAKAEEAGRDAYRSNHYGYGRRDHQSVEYATREALEEAGVPVDEANSMAVAIAGQIMGMTE